MLKVLVRNLPEDVGGVRLCEHFSQKGKITEVILRRTLDGKNLGYGYVLYGTEEDAQEAVRQFDKSYLGTHRIFWEIMPQAARRARPY